MTKSFATPEMEQLANQIGEFMQYWGFKKIHGRIWTHIYLSAVPLDATTLVKRLKVSKALVSFCMHDLLEYKVIHEVAKGRGRTVLYEANPDVTTVILNVLRIREHAMLTQVMNAFHQLDALAEAVKTEHAICPKRTLNMRGMIQSAQVVLEHLIRTGAAEDLFLGLRPVEETVEEARS